jgi:hypothetical protein
MLQRLRQFVGLVKLPAVNFRLLDYLELALAAPTSGPDQTFCAQCLRNDKWTMSGP